MMNYTKPLFLNGTGTSKLELSNTLFPLNSYVESELHVLRQENILKKELTEKIDAEGTLDDICKPLNDDTIKSLKSAHVNEVSMIQYKFLLYFFVKMHQLF